MMAGDFPKATYLLTFALTQVFGWTLPNQAIIGPKKNRKQSTKDKGRKRHARWSRETR